ncbi:hypothetical protein R6Q57_011301 [Mikania cordata]
MYNKDHEKKPKIRTFFVKVIGLPQLSPNSPSLALVVNGPGKNSLTPLVQCTKHMCPIRVQWHVKLNYKEYWRVKVTITNFNYRMNYSQWNLVVQHPNFDNLTQINYKPLTPYSSINDTAMLWGVNDFFNQVGECTIKVAVSQG